MYILLYLGLCLISNSTLDIYPRNFHQHAKINELIVLSFHPILVSFLASETGTGYYCPEVKGSRELLHLLNFFPSLLSHPNHTFQLYFASLYPLIKL